MRFENPFSYPQSSEFKYSSDMRMNSHSESAFIDDNDTPIKLLRNSPNIQLQRNNLSIEKEKRMIKQIEKLKHQNELLKKKVKETNGLLLTEKETHLKLLKQNNSLTQQMQVLKKQSKAMEKRIQQSEMMNSKNQGRTPRVSTQQKYHKSQEVKKRLISIIDHNPERLPFYTPLMYHDILTERSSINNQSMQKKRSGSIRLLSKEKHSIDRKLKFEDRAIPRQSSGISLTQRPGTGKTRIVVHRKDIYNNY